MRCGLAGDLVANFLGLMGSVMRGYAGTVCDVMTSRNCAILGLVSDDLGAVGCLVSDFLGGMAGGHGSTFGVLPRGMHVALGCVLRRGCGQERAKGYRGGKNSRAGQRTSEKGEGHGRSKMGLLGFMVHMTLPRVPRPNCSSPDAAGVRTETMTTKGPMPSSKRGAGGEDPAAGRPVMAEKVQTIPLSEAALCCDCDTISDGKQRCPKCGSSALWLLEKWINRGLVAA